MRELMPNDDPMLKDRIGLCSKELDRNKIKEELIECMEDNNGVGLSANQVGISERVFVMYSDVKKREIIACFNPFITEYSKKKVVMDEGCLTWPGIWLKVERPESILCNFEDELGEHIQVTMHGLESRIFQHEYDHMEGTNFTEQVSKLKLDMAKRRATKVKKKSLLLEIA
tara:strand:+ start:425 stop:937 length:513 start_codon:yes stop_codon:yes gene_type:complete